jgi:hypothetical protein
LALVQVNLLTKSTAAHALTRLRLVMRPPPLRMLLMIMTTMILAGCASYQLGAPTLYRQDIQTVYVPVFRSDSYRRNLGEWLTEAVVKEIQLKTPYRIANAADADSVLDGRIVSETKRVLSENRDDIPRNIETSFVVTVTWQSPQGDLLRPAMNIPLPPLLQIGQAANFIPEAGQSGASSQQQVIRQLAEQIVAQMEYPW